ncbi:MAG: redox-regulated ATPase YchF [Planctomycetes bacterium]|nr:redox-regulated ATPase YchF [Planctomycetota bacterium]
MGFRCGIVGLPNVGKSTIFNALTNSAQAEAANFPFCTIEPNTGIVEVPDHRLQDIAACIPPQKLVPTTMTFVDIAGLVAGASRGEGLGNKFLAHIRETQAIAHVVRCFEDTNVVHVDGSVDPVRDVDVIHTELLLCDLETVTKRHQNLQRKARGGDKETIKTVELLERIRPHIDDGTPVRAIEMSPEDRARLSDLHLLTDKAVLYVANVSEDDIAAPEECALYQKLAEHSAAEGASIVALCGKIESELAELTGEERTEFLNDLGLAEPGLNRVIRAGYELLNLQTYFTAGEKEVRAWTFPSGATAPQAAGVIHSDFERGFIKADVYHYDDLMKYRSEAAVKEAGKMRLEGKTYVVRDGDIMHFRFAV